MLINILVLAVVLVLAAVFAVIFFRSGRASRNITRWGGRLVGGLGTLGFLVLAGLLARGMLIYYPRQPVTALEIPVTAQAMSASEQQARGEHLAASLCAACHTTTGELPLAGGINMSDDIGMPMGDLFAPNLTPAGNVKNYTDTDFWRLFRQGIHPDGRRTIMPISALSNLSDEDLHAVITYLRSQPAVEHTTPPTNPSPLAALAVGAGMLDLTFEPITGAVTAPPRAASVEYGRYLVSFSDCVACHGQNLDGNVTPPLPQGPSLRAVKGWTAEQFITAMHTGLTPAGHELQPPMPWRTIGKMDDLELTAMWEYLKSLE